MYIVHCTGSEADGHSEQKQQQHCDCLGILVCVSCEECLAGMKSENCGIELASFQNFVSNFRACFIRMCVRRF